MRWCFLLTFVSATAMAAATDAIDKPLSIEDLEELDDNLEELLSDEESKVIEKRWDQRPPRPPSHHEYKAAVAAATAHYGQQRLTAGGGGELHHHPQQHQLHHHHEVQEIKASPVSRVKRASIVSLSSVHPMSGLPQDALNRNNHSVPFLWSVLTAH